jgi:hypothetical protein
MDMKTILEEAREVYEKTMCGAAGCCGDFYGAMAYIDGEVGKMIQEIAGSLDVGNGQDNPVEGSRSTG